MIEHYIRYQENEPPVRVEVDLDLADDEMSFTRPLLLWVFIKLQKPDASGLCTPQECDALLRMREAVAEALERELGARFSGSRLCEGWYELYFYARSGKKLIATTGAAMQAFSGYTFDTGSSRDEEWEHYAKELYPDTPMSHQIQNRHIIAELLEAGDDITIPREVEHYLFFQLPAQEERAVARLSALGYEPTASVEGEEPFAYGVVLTKVQSVGEREMMEAVSEMLETAAAEHGRYEGWSTVTAEGTDD